MAKSKIAVSIDTDVLVGIKELAAADSRSVSAYINKVLVDHLADQVAKPSEGKKKRGG